jgi:hypothetical protein
LEILTGKNAFIYKFIRVHINVRSVDRRLTAAEVRTLSAGGKPREIE